MSENIYQTPQSDVAMDDDGLHAEFYVVSLKKFSILFFSTIGIYSIYWFYKNWSILKGRYNLNIWPAPRALFSIFFAHALFGKIARELKNKTDRDWHGSALATLYVVSSVLSTVLDRVSSKGVGSPITDLLSLLILIPIWGSLYSAQKQVNLACGDEQGESNTQLTGQNIVFMLLGAVLWLLILLGLLMTFGLIPEDFTE